MAEKKLAISGNYLSAPFHDPAKREEILQEADKRFALLKEFGGKNIIIGPPGVKADADRPQLIKQQAPLLNEIGKRAQGLGLQIGIHPHLNTLVETPAEIDLAMETTDPRYVHFSADTGHIHLAGGDVPAILRKYKTRLNYFHFKDGVRPFVRPDFKPNLRELGRGEVDFPKVMKLLKEIRFTGWVNIEQDSTTLTPQESCRISMEYVNKMLKPIYG
jgi:inosose dehydratase